MRSAKSPVGLPPPLVVTYAPSTQESPVLGISSSKYKKDDDHLPFTKEVATAPVLFHVGFCLIIYLRDFCCHYLEFWFLHIVCSCVHLPCSYVQFSVSGHLLSVSPFHLVAASYSDAGISLPGI